MHPLREDTRLHLRRMRASDLSQVVQIEQQAFPSPWPQEIFCDCLKAGMSCWVLAHNGLVDAYGVMSIETTHAHIPAAEAFNPGG